MSEPLVQVRDLKTHFPIRRGALRRVVGAVKAVDGVSFDIIEGETLGLVGESGSGKSTTARTILRLIEPTSGSVSFGGTDLTTLSRDDLRGARQQMQMIFQDPYASLNPRHTVRRIVREPLDIHRVGSAASRESRVLELLELVGLESRHADRYPHEFSGGQRQRVGIARALATRPRLIVADEPISALDVSIQAQIVNLMEALKADLGLTYLFIAHDLSMVRHTSDRVAVMYLGRIVEIGATDDVFERPLHPYTRALIAAIPVADPARMASRVHAPLEGDVPSPSDPPSGCHFNSRCPFATDICRVENPESRVLDVERPGSMVACHHADSLPDRLSQPTSSAHPSKDPT
ncbi:MAG: ABC transporter ATP-binding protein [Longimicrobiales bacterium]